MNEPLTTPPTRGRLIPQIRGRLTIFLGYAVGVGKCHAMLQAAQQRQTEGQVVVAGCVMANGRSDLPPLLANIETIPLHPEMDTAAILQRQPQLVLVEQIAHHNAPHSRHHHRYQDVLELLNSGMDVYATLNVQHLESLNDIVARVTGFTVRETIPDHIFDEAHEIVLVDLPVDELLARFQSGQIPRPPLAEALPDTFFRRGNLTALREMALRRAADHVDEQMRDYMQRQGIAGPWAASERLLVGVSPSPLSARLVRATRRLAQQLNAEWIAAYVEPPSHLHLPTADEERVAQTLRLAEELGAKTARLSGESVAETLVAYARSRNVTKIVAGKPLRSRWQAWRHGSIIDQILRHSQDLDVYVISGKKETAVTKRQRLWGDKRSFKGGDYLLGAGLALLVTGLGFPLRPFINPTNLVTLYLAAVVVTAVRLGRWPAVVTSVFSVILFDIIFVPPYLTFAVADAEYILTFVGFLAVGLVISALASQTQEQAQAARRREAQTAVLYDLSQALAAVSTPATIAQTAVQHIQTAYNSPSAIFLPTKTEPQLTLQASSSDFYLEAENQTVADWVFTHGQPAGRHTDTFDHAHSYYRPLQTAGRVVGVIAIQFSTNDHEIQTSEQRRFLTSFANQIALALAKADLAEQAQHARLLEETEKLQTTLLNSISHDLRTPLATITGALSSLREDADLLSASAQQELLQAAWDEGLRLNRFVGNLLDMTRLESGRLKVLRQPYDVQELVGTTLAQMPNRLRGRPIKTTIPADLPAVSIDLTLMAQALMNLVDNAVKYTPPSELIEIEAYQAEQMVVVAVKDRGPGLPEAELERVFSKFFRLNRSGIGGTGLGLSIAKGIVEAHNGRVWAQNRDGGGAIFNIALPLTPPTHPPLDDSPPPAPSKYSGD